MRKWVVVSVLAPLAAWLLAKLADRLETRNADTRLVRALRAPHRWRHAGAA
jgi:hypothetical protein